jgi:hypothetical protein
VAGGPIQITYRAAKNNWAVASGVAGGKIFFVRQVLYRDTMAGFEIVYPVSEKTRLDGVVARLNTCLKIESQNPADAAGKIAERNEPDQCAVSSHFVVLDRNPSFFPWISLDLLAFIVSKYRSSYV